MTFRRSCVALVFLIAFKIRNTVEAYPSVYLASMIWLQMPPVVRMGEKGGKRDKEKAGTKDSQIDKRLKIRGINKQKAH